MIFDHANRATWLSASQPRALVPIIAPSILASDFARLLEECEGVLSPAGGAAEWLHVDVMDGHFVPNISIGMCVVEALRRHLAHAFLDVHCMIASPEKWINEMAKAGASQMTFHVEATNDAAAVAQQIRAAGMQCGVALKPKTPLTAIEELIKEKAVDTVLIMTVEPGFGGQSFMHDMMPKVKALRKAHPTLNIQVDGGLSEKTIGAAAEAGANIIVAGTSIFKAASRKESTETMRKIVQGYLSAA